MGLCPFHPEKTPSFGVNIDRQIYKCFRCDVAGDAIDFIQRIEVLSFREAVKLLGNRYGIPFVYDGKPTKRIGSAELADAESFRISFVWWLERYLADLKELWTLGESGVDPGAICDTTRLLSLARRWSRWRAYEFLERFRSSRPDFVGERIAEGREFERELMDALLPKGPKVA